MAANGYPTLEPAVRAESLPGVSVSRLMGERVLIPEIPRVAHLVGQTGQTQVSGPQRIPAVQLAHLRGLYASYQAALDATLIGMGPPFERGGCKVDLVRGIVMPPEGR